MSKIYDATSVREIARLCHEVNKAYCIAIGDDTQPDWWAAPAWQKASAINGVEFHVANPDAGPEASHESWRALKVADGWTWGAVKNPETKQHPCLVDFAALPEKQQVKDHLFRGVVHAMTFR